MTNNSIDWKQEIVSTVLVRSNIYDLDLGKIYGYSLPKLAAADAEIERSENRLGFQFDEDYRSFLRHANGWDSLALSDGHAFGVGEYPNGPRYLEATRLMNLIWHEGSFLDIDAEIEMSFPSAHLNIRRIYI